MQGVGERYFGKYPRENVFFFFWEVFPLHCTVYNVYIVYIAATVRTAHTVCKRCLYY